MGEGKARVSGGGNSEQEPSLLSACPHPTPWSSQKCSFSVPKLHTLICCVQSCKASWQEHSSVSGLLGNKYTWVFRLNELRAPEWLDSHGEPKCLFPQTPNRSLCSLELSVNTDPWVPASWDRCPHPQC